MIALRDLAKYVDPDVTPADPFAVMEARKRQIDKPSIRFSEHLIADHYDYAYGLAAVDIEGDGDLDLTSVDIRNKTAALGKQRSDLFWFENNGLGAFRKRIIAEDQPGWFERHAAGDIDGDGKPDVVVVNNQPDVPGSDKPQANLIWFANNVKPTAGSWKRSVITTKCPRAYDVALADFDGDGRLDVAASGYTSNLVTWYRNPGKDGWDRDWPQTRIDEKMPEARTIRAGDFNGDGKTDLLCTSFGHARIPLNVTDGNIHGCSIVWYENPGPSAGRPWKKHIIDDRTRAPVHGHPADMDGDGDIDVVMAFGMGKEWSLEAGHEVVWYENVGRSGNGRAWKKHHIGKLPSAFEAFAADLDGDRDVDVVATGWAKGDRVVWLENSGNPQGKWTMHVLKVDWHAANQVIVADLNGDKRPDVAATADAGSSRVNGAKELRWWRNEGPHGRKPQREAGGPANGDSRRQCRHDLFEFGQQH